MKKARKTTLEERICIVKDCLDHDRNYGAMALKYDCIIWNLKKLGLEDQRPAEL